MSEAVFDSQVPFLEQKMKAAIVLCRTEHGNLHAGIFHHNDVKASVLHLGWEDYLCHDWRWQKYWATPPNIDPERLALIAGLCRRVWRIYESDRRFPYALRFDGTHFNQRGALVLGPNSKGLTCATFVLAIFKSNGVILIDEKDWPIRQIDDQKFLESIAGFARKEHWEVLKAEVDSGCVRIRPEEVLGACSCSLPAKFIPTRAAADQIQKQLTR